MDLQGIIGVRVALNLDKRDPSEVPPISWISRLND